MPPRFVAKKARPRRRWLRRMLLLVAMLLATPLLLVLALRWIDPPTSAFMLAHRLGDNTEPLQQRWVALEHIAPALQLAVIAAEDQRFPEHHGFDVEAIRAALEEDGTGGRGASTISQQVAKNLFLWKGRSLLRKGLEAGFTGAIELAWPKRRVLEVYLNIAEFGPGIYGAEAAAQQHFGKPAARLQTAEAARLAAVLPNPRRFDASDPSPYVHQRARWIERQMRQLGGPALLERLP
jgi:monofunctional glycosyltransferase